jgi:hypothetical protein
MVCRYFVAILLSPCHHFAIDLTPFPQHVLPKLDVAHVYVFPNPSI